jgi:hypothetical protein
MGVPHVSPLLRDMGIGSWKQEKHEVHSCLKYRNINTASAAEAISCALPYPEGYHFVSILYINHTASTSTMTCVRGIFF